MLIMIINLSLTLMFIFLTHPISMGSLLLMQTILVSLLIGNLNINFWFSYILFLILIGGMMVLFLYMTSIASNETFKKNFLLFLPLLLFLIYPLVINNQTMNFYINNQECYLFSNNTEFQQILTKFINLPYQMVFMFMVIYLLLTLIAVVNITGIQQGPLRHHN
uniref:NADH-ubiquinone oxidoreductase chain 6 n=1 Tax=Coleoptera sp. 11 KM-2017 TaxID=2219314 RepID=A0A346RGH5_9COLE|nr:NADH dehydrogenase subunit 6 [Coleoptera sp. 11 KM-2017]